MRILHTLIILTALAVTVCSCKPGKPSGVLSDSKMEDVLYDFHLAQALARQMPTDSVDYYLRKYEEAVYTKYGIDSQTFHTSLAWYERHTDNLAKIYDRLSERFGEGGNFTGTVHAGGEAGDTLDIWHGQPFVLLSSQGVNHYTYEEKADTSLHEGDMLQWQFNADWHYHEGAREAMAMLVVRYEGDSTAVSRLSIYSSGLQTVSTRIGKPRVKRIECIIYQDAPWNKRPRILTIALPQLLRIRSKQLQAEAQAEAEAARRDSSEKAEMSGRLHLRDSLVRDDSARERRPHFR